MRFGFISLGENDFPGVDRDDRAYYREYLRIAELVDGLDYSSLWVGEHHFGHVASISSSVAFLAAIATRTSKIELGTAVNVGSFHHPIRLVEDYATLDQVSDGRAQLGLGTGYAAGEFHGMGVPIDDARERAHEMLRFCESAFETGRTGFAGHFHKFPDMPLVPLPVQQPIPLNMAVLGSASLGRLRGPTWLSPADLEPVSGIDGSQPRRHRGSLPDDRSREWPRSAEDEGPVLHALLRGR